MAGAIQLAKGISWFIKQRNQLGPFPTEAGDGWQVASHICHDCGSPVIEDEDTVYEEYDMALKVAEKTIQGMAQEDLDSLHVFGPAGSLCSRCDRIAQKARKFEEIYCSSCGNECGFFGCPAYMNYLSREDEEMPDWTDLGYDRYDSTYEL